MGSDHEGATPLRYARRLNLFDATMMTVGGIIGAGIFLNPAIVAQRVGTPGLTVVAWMIGGAIGLAGALCFAELGSRFPRAGGGYVFLRDAFGPLAGFLYGWALLLVINSGALAAVSAIAAQYTLSLIARPDASALPLTIGFLWFFSAVNYFGIRAGAIAQNVFTTLKLVALAVVIVAGVWWGTGALPATALDPGSVPIAAAPSGFREIFLAMGAALIPVMFAMGGWQNTNFIGAEIRDPRRTLPRAIVLGVVIVVTVYVLANVAYLRALGIAGLAASNAPASATVAAAAGPTAAWLIDIGIVVSTLGILNLFILSAPRVYQAMADDGVFFRAASRLHPRYRTPAGALVFQAVWASILALSGTYGQLLDYVVFGDWIFFGLAAATLFVYRARERRGESASDAPADGDTGTVFRSPAIAVIGGGFIAAAAFIVVSSIASNPGNAALGAALIAAGVPVFHLWRRSVA